MRRVVRKHCLDMDMRIGRNVQAACMGMQQRHQALQEYQNQDQAIISEIVSHLRILNFNRGHHQF
jgi:hypothetical protein